MGGKENHKPPEINKKAFFLGGSSHYVISHNIFRAKPALVLPDPTVFCVAKSTMDPKAIE